jgi:Spy/CpxP family protein refolding chaperone
MTRRMLIGIGTVLGGTLLIGAGALAWGHGGRGVHHAVMKRVAVAMVDEALDAAQATPEQRTVAHAARDRVFAAVEQHHRSRSARKQEVLALFEADTLDPARVAALRQSAEAEHRAIGDAVSQAVADAHQALTPAQRKLLADYVRRHRHE